MAERDEFYLEAARRCLGSIGVLSEPLGKVDPDFRPDAGQLNVRRPVSVFI